MLNNGCAAVLLIGIAAGCNRDKPIYFDDNISTQIFDLGEQLFPYVPGATVRIGVYNLPEGVSVSDWTVERTAPSTFEITDVLNEGSDINISAAALNGGVSLLKICDADGAVAHEATIYVGALDRAELISKSMQDAGRYDAHEDSRKVVVGGQATFEVLYFQGAHQLFGNGVLEAEHGADIDTDHETSEFFADDEWLQVRPRAAGEHVISLSVGGYALSDFVIEGVSPVDVEEIELYKESIGAARPGDTLNVNVDAFDANGARIFGVLPEWTFDGVALDDVGDVLEYDYMPGRFVEVVARFADQEVSIEVEGGNPDIDDSNAVSCAAAGVAGRGGLVGILLGLVGGCGLRRRR